jgi:hypothetical protein
MELMTSWSQLCRSHQACITKTKSLIFMSKYRISVVICVRVLHLAMQTNGPIIVKTRPIMGIHSSPFFPDHRLLALIIWAELWWMNDAGDL